MASVINKQVGAGLSYKDLFLLGATKIATERLSKDYIGNATFKSGTIKTVIGGVVSYLVKQRQIRFMAAGVALDGAEDLITSGINYYKKNSNNKKELTQDELIPVL